MKLFKRVIFAGIGVFVVLGLCIGVLYFLNGDLGDQQEEKPGSNALAGEEISRDLLLESSWEAARSESSGAESSGLEAQEPSSADQTAPSEEVPESSVEASSEAVQESVESSKESVESSKESVESSKESKESTKESVESSKESAESSKESVANGSAESNAGQTTAQDQLVDKQAPVFLAFTASPQIKVGNSFDVHKYCGYADDVDRQVDIEVTGEVDTSKEGSYPIKIKLTDDAGHVTTKEMKVQVVSSVSSSGGQGKKENFSDFVKNYKTEETSLGIDISRWQETVDFEKIKAAGCEFVYMRLGGYDEGELYTDRYYLQNMAGAKAAGLKIGIYWHSEESSREEIKASIDYMMKVLDGQKLDFPIAFDWEDFMNFERYGMNLYDINHVLDYFAEEIEARGYKACLYGSKNRLETLWTNEKKLPIWIAHYTSATSYGGDYFMWQHSCTGRIDGINGDVDLDVLYNAKANFN